jgi:hypothetical protein
LRATAFVTLAPRKLLDSLRELLGTFE